VVFYLSINYKLYEQCMTEDEMFYERKQILLNVLKQILISQVQKFHDVFNINGIWTLVLIYNDYLVFILINKGYNLEWKWYLDFEIKVFLNTTRK